MFFNVDLETMFLSYEQIASRFTEIYWNLVLKYHLRQQIKTAQHEYTSFEPYLNFYCC